MRFLVDECLHLSLVDLLNTAGFEAHHVVRLGMRGAKDHEVMRRVRSEEFVLVTNNAVDFRRLHAKEEIHPGLLILIPNVVPERQRALLSVAIRHIGGRAELINTVIEADLDDGEVVIREYALPPN